MPRPLNYLVDEREVECPLIAYTDLDGSFCKDLDETLSRHVEHSLERR